MNKKIIIEKLNNAIWDLENAYDVKDIYNVSENLKKIVKELEE